LKQGNQETRNSRDPGNQETRKLNQKHKNHRGQKTKINYKNQEAKKPENRNPRTKNIHFESRKLKSCNNQKARKPAF